MLILEYRPVLWQHASDGLESYIILDVNEAKYWGLTKNDQNVCSPEK